MRLIDADALYEEMDYHVTSVSVCATVDQARGMTRMKQMCLKDVQNAPTVDAVPVVRCKDCKFGMLLFTMSGMLYVGCEKDKMARLRKPNDYCSEGERKTKDGGEENG